MGDWINLLKSTTGHFCRLQITDRPESIDCRMKALLLNITAQRKRTNAIFLFCLPLLLCLNPITATATDWVYTVQSGDNLWDLSTEHMGSIENWRKLQKLNNVTNPKLIPPGTRIRFPLAWLKIKSASIRVLELTGEVSATSSQAGTAILLKPGTTLVSGDEINTGPNGNVLLEFLDHSRLLLQKNSHLILEKQNTYSNSGVMDTRVRLLNGRIETVINPEQKNGTRFEIHTPAAITGVRGTDFRVAMENDQKVGRTEVTHGKVAVSGTAGKTIEVPASFGTVVTVGQPPSAPKPLLPPPDLSRLPNHIAHFPLVFEWPEIDGAEFYRAQISNATTTGALMIDEAALSNPLLHIAELPDGDYLLRVRAIDANGLEGLNTDHKFTLVLPIEPPLLITPSPNATIRKQSPDFRWKKSKNATTFHFQLSSNSDFSSQLIDIPNLQETYLNVEQKLDPGDYYWRVASSTTFGKQSTFSPTEQFSLQPKSDLAWMLFFFPLLLLL